MLAVVVDERRELLPRGAALPIALPAHKYHLRLLGAAGPDDPVDFILLAEKAWHTCAAKPHRVLRIAPSDLLK